MTTDGWSWEIARPLVTPRPRPRDSWNSNSGYISIFLQRLELYISKTPLGDRPPAGDAPPPPPPCPCSCASRHPPSASQRAGAHVRRWQTDAKARRSVRRCELRALAPQTRLRDRALPRAPRSPAPLRGARTLIVGHGPRIRVIFASKCAAHGRHSQSVARDRHQSQFRLVSGSSSGVDGPRRPGLPGAPLPCSGREHLPQPPQLHRRRRRQPPGGRGPLGRGGGGLGGAGDAGGDRAGAGGRCAADSEVATEARARARLRAQTRVRDRANKQPAF